MTDTPVVVVDNTDEFGAILGPNTRFHVYETVADAKTVFPDALVREELQLGDTLDAPIICQIDTHEAI